MRKRVESLSFIAIVAGVALICCGSMLQAQSDTPQSSAPQSQQQPQQPPDTQAPTPQQPQSQQSQPSQGQASQGQGQASQDPNAKSPTSDAGGNNEFIGTVMKQGDKYMFQDAASGQTYDIDHQDEVKKFDGKKVRVHGTLDPSTKMIHVQ